MPSEKFIAQRLPNPFATEPFRVSSVENPIPTSADLPTFAVSPLFAAAMDDRRCPKCDLGVIYHSPDACPEETIHLNANATAYLNTAGEAFARIYGDDTYRFDHGKTFIELVRLFLLTTPAIESLKYDTRPGRVARGKVTEAEWVDVSTPSTSADPVETPGPEAAPPAPSPGEGETLPPEVIAIQSADPEADLYDEAGEPNDLYIDTEGATHPEGD